MNDEEVDRYIQYLWTQYQTDNKEINKGIGQMIEEVREKLLNNREIVMNFNIEEIHDLHMCIFECLAYHSEDKDHQKEYEKEECLHCKNYKKLYDRIVEKCDCIDNPKGKHQIKEDYK